MKREIYIFIGSLELGGGQKVCVTLANFLSNKGYSVKLVVLNQKNDHFTHQLDEKVTLINLNIKRNDKFKRNLFKFLNQKKPRLALSFNIVISLYIILWKKIFREDTIIITRIINSLSNEFERISFLKKLIYIPLIKYTLKNSNTLISQCEGMKQDLILNYGSDENKILTINNPVYSIKEEKNCFEEYSFNKEYKYLLFMGRLSYQKNIFELIEAFELTIKERKNIKLLIVGAGELKDEIINFVKNRNLENYVIFIDSTKNPMFFYKRCVGTILSSLYEGFPNVLLESISVGTPVISYDCPFGPSEIISETNGLLVEYRNIAKLSSAIIELVDKEWDKQEIILSAKKFDVEKILLEYLRAIERSEGCGVDNI